VALRLRALYMLIPQKQPSGMAQSDGDDMGSDRYPSETIHKVYLS
jgi:hypothetical protein